MTTSNRLEKIPKDDTRRTPQGELVLSRLESICKDMERDIKECYNGRLLVTFNG
jgi:hypothetical protein